jgi:hypothetical protein
VAKGFQKVMVPLLIGVLLGSVICALVSSGVCVARSSGYEKGLGVLRDFFGLDLSKYEIVVEESYLSDPLLGDVLYESVFFSLTSADSKIRLVFTFVGNNLQNMYVFENEGTPLLKSIVKESGVAVSVVGCAQGFFNSCEQYWSRSVFGNLKATLDGVCVDKNFTKPVGNAVFDMIVYDDVGFTNFIWYFPVENTSVDGVPYIAVVSLGFKDGSLVSFTDTLAIYGVDKAFELYEYDIANNSVAVSSVSDGLYSKSIVSSNVGGVGSFVIIIFVVVVVGGFVGGLFLRGSIGGSCFRWFFAKKIKGVGLFFIFLLFLTVFLPLVGSVNALQTTNGGGVVWGSRSSGASNDLYGSHSWRKTNDEISRQEAVARFLSSNCLVAANGYTCFSNIWANKSNVLSQAQRLNTDFNHVVVFDWDHGVGGYPGAISSPNSYLGVPDDELHYMFEDDWGTFVGGPSAYSVDWNHGVYDVDIYEAFSAGKVHFALINTCLSANIELFGQGGAPSGYPLGMPYAFTHRMVGYVSEGSNSSLISADGYNCPDAFPQCYIGFPFGSAALDQPISYNGNWQPWYQWIVFFSYMAFNFDVSVNESLDWACSMQWGRPSFEVSPLQGEGFTAVWPVWDTVNKTFTADVPNAQGLHSTLAVYGNGNIHLKNFQTTHTITYPYIDGPKQVDVEALSEFSVYSVDSINHQIQYTFDWGDGTPQTVTDYAVAGVPVNVSHFWSTAGVYEVIVRAQCEDGTWSNWSEIHTVTVGSSYWLTITVISLILAGLVLLVLVLWYRFRRH